MEEIRFRVDFVPAAEENFRDLDFSVKKMIKKAIELKLQVDPVAFGKPLRYALAGHRRLRVGDYRIVYRINAPKKTVTIIAIGNRKDIY